MQRHHRHQIRQQAERELQAKRTEDCGSAAAPIPAAAAEAGSRAAGLRVLLGQRQGSSYTSDLTDEGISQMVDAAIAIAQTNPRLRVAVVSKVYPMRSHTVSAEGGAAGVVAPGKAMPLLPRVQPRPGRLPRRW